MHIKLLISVFFISLSFGLLAQDTLTTTTSATNTVQENRHLTILYDISIKSNKTKPDIEEAYNGGNKTVFIHGDNIRVRLVSLMRIQSIFFFPANVTGKNIFVVKESGKQKYKYHLSNAEWQTYNNKYDSVQCLFKEDSLEILNYNCKKAIITLIDGKKLVVYYTPMLKPVSFLAEPAFKCIPGLVLQYSYTTNKGSITYTASKVSENVIDPSIFTVPNKGYITKSYKSATLEKNSYDTESIE